MMKRFLATCLVWLVAATAYAQNNPQTMLDADSVDETAEGVQWNDTGELTIYIEWGAGTTAGVIEIEEANLLGYTGTWASVTTVSWAAASSTDVVHLSGSFRAVRTRISTAIANGTVTTRVVGR